MAGHKPGYLFLILFTFSLFLVSLVLYIVNFTIGSGIGWFMHSAMELGQKYHLEIAPPIWTIATIWTVNFLYQMLCHLYIITTICRSNETKQTLLYYDPHFLPPSLYITLIVNLVIVIAMLFVFDREHLGITLGLAIAAAITAYIAISISYRALHKASEDLKRMGLKQEIILVKGMVQNGIAIASTWMSVGVLYNLAVVLTYVVGMDQKDASTLMLGLLGLFMLIYHLVDILGSDIYTRYIITPYILLIFYFTGIVLNIWQWDNRNSIIVAILLGLSCFGFIYKLTMMCIRKRQHMEEKQRRTTNGQN